MVLYTEAPAARQQAVQPAVRAGRLLAQRTLFAGPSPDAPDELYVAPVKGVLVQERTRLTLDGHAVASTNTYFGRFPASYWQRWTSARSVDVSAVVSGSGQVRVMASDSAGEARAVATRRIDDGRSEAVELTVAIDKFVDGGALWLEFRTTAAELTVEQVRWTVAAIRPRRSTAVVICTYNRADDCLATLRTLVSDPEVTAELGAVYVIDQGTDTVDSRDSFPAVAELLGSTLHYIRQPNLGGAGGFTRGIYEAVRNETSDRVNLLLMDDDIRLEPDTVFRLRALADRADQPVIVGGQMLNLLHPDRLHVGAETVDLGILRAGLPVKDALANTDVTEEQQDIRVDADYNAWWSCLIPSEVVQAIGYPLPMFFQWDDIEYGLRARAAGFPTVTLPGAGVWHAEFSWKNWDDWSRYFSFRNSLITSALHSDFDRRRLVNHLAKQLVDSLVSMRYGLAALTIRAVEDFLRGPSVLDDGGADTVAEVRKLWAAYPETANHPVHAVPGVPSVGMPRTTSPGTPSMLRSVLAKRIIWQLLRKPSGTAAVPVSDASWWHVAQFDTAVVTDDSQEGVRVRRFDRGVMLELARRGGEVLWRLARDGERAREQYRSQLPELTDRETWTRLFEGRRQAAER
ncbi:galactofuranosylgalactofuranosylrhamnosyl-N-acetylglucosaminyl-diphospho-decaprenol beta-1,5/1,6-galactofuranosyltransferase [Blastococcus colisei]|uniref:Galactofuranosylgalactofuranosylrhamnosyl-N-acetylglucosaminyl-diphospho-decaprenol beta-1,5/1,6-galactofuranosyltransferase n=1 Tax=Blastococcus colisei TaxID=1564162 RepID=A0A543PBU7_9ACTN|nr:glycosyltransferase [Blastococcus colisei]TQN41545.1 galactofuranosylgalactofuranosylrhamnosyl-N-acetylglucosaminyl-diphospho-decaprenol beta-1,5/1,6-galactofuranosyltransferase [Blastococcus colisei]